MLRRNLGVLSAFQSAIPATLIIIVRGGAKVGQRLNSMDWGREGSACASQSGSRQSFSAVSHAR